jgi:hypothetical protein
MPAIESSTTSGDVLAGGPVRHAAAEPGLTDQAMISSRRLRTAASGAARSCRDWRGPLTGC